jgi:hypothetical protein
MTPCFLIYLLLPHIIYRGILATMSGIRMEMNSSLKVAVLLEGNSCSHKLHMVSLVTIHFIYRDHFHPDKSHQFFRFLLEVFSSSVSKTFGYRKTTCIRLPVHIWRLSPLSNWIWSCIKIGWISITLAVVSMKNIQTVLG